MMAQVWIKAVLKKVRLFTIVNQHRLAVKDLLELV
jgi:hypothetical protein